MGACNSKTPEQKEAARRTKDIERQMKKDDQLEQKKLKLLLLGTGESGKSTMLKQMKLSYGVPYSPEEFKEFTPVIHSNVASAMITLTEQSILLGYVKEGTAVHTEIIAVQELLKGRQTQAVDVLSESEGQQIFKAWKSAEVQEAFANRSQKFQLTDSAPYFLDKIDELTKSDYLPDDNDVLRSRVRTTGIVENHFQIEDHDFEVYDVGGQRSERKKWIACFEGVTGVMFCGVLSEYDLTLFEDATTNRMVESVNLFDEISNLMWFQNTSMILFLNKSDLFEEKIKRIPLSICPLFSNAVDVDYETGCQLIQEKFVETVRSSTPVYTHVTCATDKEGMKAVLGAVKDSIIQKALSAAGLMAM